MFFKAFDFSKGVLGLNARNLIYIRELNSRERINFADSKLKTKHYLSARNIPVPKLIASISNQEQLNNFDFGSLPGSIVLKPNKGSGGDGIMVFKERKGDTFYSVSGRAVSIEEIKTHIADIIDGKFSIANSGDVAFFEQRIQTHSSLAKYTHQGLPDIRVIVYNLVPVMAMLRLPTIESDGKANMALGALGIGLDLATGKPTHIARKYSIISEIPGKGKFDPNFKIPFWNKILLIASKCQQITDLGYLACDITLDENYGPILLELNARAGLKVQVANKAGLRTRLEKLKDIKVTTPEKGVRVAKDLFSNKTNKIETKDPRPVLTLEENIELNLSNNKYILKASINPQKDESTISYETFLKLTKDKDKKSIKLKFNLKENKIVSIFKVDKRLKKYDLVIGRKELQGYLVNPIVKKDTIIKLKPRKKLQKDFYVINQIDYGHVDYQINQVASKIKLLSRLVPMNLNSEMEKYEKNNEYNPQFEYNPDPEFILHSINTLNSLKTDDSPLGYIFQRKKEELKTTLKMIEFLGTEDFNNYSNALFPFTTEKELTLARKYMPNNKIYRASLVGKPLTAKEVKAIFEDTLAKYGLSHWKVVLKKTMIADCSVSKSNTVFLKSNAKFHEQRIKKLIAHEIETHILTNENGKKQPYIIFQNGLAGYLETQEGLAIYNQELALHLYPHNSFVAHTYRSTHVSLNNSFIDAVELLRREGVKRESAVKTVLRSKRGLGDTSKKGGFGKNSVYFRGALKIDKFVKDGGKLEDLYLGKINIDDLHIINQIPSLNKPAYLPTWY